MRERKAVAIAVFVALVATAAIRHPTTTIRIETHEVSDPSPHVMKAAVDLGLVGVNVLVTWTAHQLIH